jgi:hypothetical protein
LDFVHFPPPLSSIKEEIGVWKWRRMEKPWSLDGITSMDSDGIDRYSQNHYFGT